MPVYFRGQKAAVLSFFLIVLSIEYTLIIKSMCRNKFNIKRGKSMSVKKGKNKTKTNMSKTE